MAAPSKTGLDYFSFDVDLLADRKFRKARLKHGYMAIMVYISLLTLIYKDKGYYIDYSDPEDVHWDVLDDLKGKFQPTAETVAEVIEDLVACELFSGDQFKSKRLTSKRIQANYYKATVERKTASIDDEVWELSLEEMKELSAKHSYYLFLINSVNQPINRVNRPNNPVNQPINSQSKVKESKVKKSKGYIKKPKGFIPPTLQEVIDYCNERNSSVNAKAFFEFYNTGNWRDSKGNEVKSWKQKLLTWESHEKPKPSEREASYDLSLFEKMNVFELGGENEI